MPRLVSKSLNQMPSSKLKLWDFLKNKSNDLVNLPLEFTKADPQSVVQIFTFGTVYPVFSKLTPEQQKSTPLYAWFKEFSQIPAVSKAIKDATSHIKIERVKEKNTGESHVAKGVSLKELDPSVKLAPKAGERNILITSALPYVNNVPHLGNIVGSVLSADIYSRYCKQRGYNTLFVCGTDEYGTATETKALEEKVTPRQLCDKYNKIHKEVYDWFQIGFDHFGRTTTQKQTEIAQDIFMKLHKNGYLEEQVMKQLYCPVHNGYLADRYVEGECPKCHYEDARGDQCDKCGGLLDPFELINPRCKLDNATPEPRDSKHVFISLDKLEPKLRAWVEKASTEDVSQEI
ncbi:unnamed protein product [Ambrosiozyma monospora]|uniref:Unnamed protein product n=1 Tax=Ambrosiozyma monospora TaxID=43982 RepID=A0ACB5TRX6_AMBMO|nr:unnamed protein product [Ambrosiozyma monospora]